MRVWNDGGWLRAVEADETATDAECRQAQQATTPTIDLPDDIGTMLHNALINAGVVSNADRKRLGDSGVPAAARLIAAEIVQNGTLTLGEFVTPEKPKKAKKRIAKESTEDEAND